MTLAPRSSMVRQSKTGRTGKGTGISAGQASDCRNKRGCLITSSPKGLPSPSIELQKRLLNIFRDAFSSRMSQQLHHVLQEIKKHLFNRDFQKAFEREEYLETYAFRWSPSRALAYMNIFCMIQPLRARLTSSTIETITTANGSLNSNVDDTVPSGSDANVAIRLEKEQNPHPPPLNDLSEGFGIVCLGGGSGAELVALAGFLHWINSTDLGLETMQVEPGKATAFDIKILDVANWSNIICALHLAVTSSPPISNYASAAAKANNAPLVNAENFNVRFQQNDVHNLCPEQLTSIFSNAKLVTLMFTLNELYSTSISATTNFLLSMTSVLPPGALLLVVDSPGSYSTVNVGKDVTTKDDISPTSNQKIKQYPLHWLLDHTLLESARLGSRDAQEGERLWQKVYSDESKWYRFAEKLTYPIELEDMRYQIHLYERI